MQIPTFIADRLERYQSEQDASGKRAQYAVYALIFVLARHEHQLGGSASFGQLLGLTRLTSRGLVLQLQLARSLGVVEAIPYGKGSWERYRLAQNTVPGTASDKEGSVLSTVLSASSNVLSTEPCCTQYITNSCTEYTTDQGTVPSTVGGATCHAGARVLSDFLRDDDDDTTSSSHAGAGAPGSPTIDDDPLRIYGQATGNPIVAADRAELARLRAAGVDDTTIALAIRRSVEKTNGDVGSFAYVAKTALTLWKRGAHSRVGAPVARNEPERPDAPPPPPQSAPERSRPQSAGSLALAPAPRREQRAKAASDLVTDAQLEPVFAAGFAFKLGVRESSGRDASPAEIRAHLFPWAAEHGIDVRLVDAAYPEPRAPRPELVAAPPPPPALEPHPAPPDEDPAPELPPAASDAGLDEELAALARTLGMSAPVGGDAVRSCRDCGLEYYQGGGRECPRCLARRIAEGAL